jgi:hypothetical protein
MSDLFATTRNGMHLRAHSTMSNFNSDIQHTGKGLNQMIKTHLSSRAWRAVEPNHTMSFANKDFEINKDEKLNNTRIILSNKQKLYN